MTCPPQLVGGRYALQQEIGRGGMGTVWRAYDELLGRAVAAKEVLPPPELGPLERAHLLEQTLREARSAARIATPAAVTVHDIVEQDGRPWIVMELLDARSLGQVLREDGLLPPQRAAQIGLAVLQALDAAHGSGVVHRDVKPANVLLCRDGRTVLTDFGIAVLDGEATPSSPGTVLGSPAYMAPERLRGAPPAPAMDLWSLGATLGAAVSGSSPFARSDLGATIRAVTDDPLPVVPAPPGPLADAVQGLLQRDPRQRLDSAQARALLEQAAAAAPGPPPPQSAAGPIGIAPATESTTGAVPVVDAAGRRSPWWHPWTERGLGLLTGLLLLLAVAAVAVPRLRPDGTGRSAGPSASPSGAPAPAAPGRPASGSPAPPAIRTYHDPSGFSLQVPRDWEATPRGTQVEFREPGGQRFLSVSRTGAIGSDPAADWRQQEPYVAGRLQGYRLLSIRPVDYRGWRAADWDFTWQSPSGPLRVRDRGMSVAPGRGFGLYFSAPPSSWDASQAVFDSVTSSFAPG